MRVVGPLMEPVTVEVWLWGKCVVKNAATITAGFDALLAALNLTDTAFPKGVIKTWKLFREVVCEFPPEDTGSSSNANTSIERSLLRARHVLFK